MTEKRAVAAGAALAVALSACTGMVASPPFAGAAEKLLVQASVSLAVALAAGIALGMAWALFRDPAEDAPSGREDE